MEKRILVIDDNEDDFVAVRRVLEKQGYRALYAPSGEKGIELVRENYPECILLDRKMPVMDGLETCHKLKGNEESRHIPVILWTVADTEQEIIQGIEAGADDFVSKSSDYELLLVRIKAMLRIRQLYVQLEAALSYSRKMVYFSKNTNTIQMGEIIETLKENLEEIFGAQSFSLFLYDKNSDTLRLTAHNQESLKGKDITIKRNRNSIIWEALDRNQPFAISNFEGSPYFSGINLHRDSLVVLYPLIVGKEIIGVVNMNSLQESKLPEELIERSAAAVEHLASAISNCRAYQKMKELSIIDELTHLFNRRCLYMELGKELPRAKRHNHNSSFIMIDIDHFKPINDKYGHLYGDFILRELASILTGSRTSDRFFRFGGEEFFAILPETPPKNALVAAERLRMMVKGHEFRYRGISTHLTISLGVTSYPADKINTAEDAIRLADQRLYKAKESGRDQVFPSFQEGNPILTGRN